MTGRAMPDEGFLKRWARRKSESRQGIEPAPEALPPLPPDDTAALAPPHADAVVPTHAPAPVGEDSVTEAPRLPTMEDVAALQSDSDYSGFVARGVDQAVRRSALKKLFADPHFNTMDGLDIYIDDYNKPSPLSETMLASLRHAARLFEGAADEPEAAGDPRPGQDPPIPTTPPETETR